ncbi:CPBP family intramembrane metalloprotease [Colwellia sp. D2M02]|uniref:CPBP family intramembrane glutamic endopeptidase n=1 Tax=Colwellia sp. D2M02 TaxID=2841562 RepID=UPI001C088D94|nr:CPBP family intramembrane glutamic endopeptidase [Colwellia sp. D2M02]MBU2892763.1 CPBP family intramembrane metalloprotease [Colwellia sp. D2M02]
MSANTDPSNLAASSANATDVNITQAQPNKPWSASATLGLSFLLFILYCLLSALMLGAVSLFETANPPSSDALMMDGDCLAINYLLTALALSPFIFYFAGKRKLTTASAYLGFDKLPSKKMFINFTLVLFAYFALTYVASEFFAIEMPQSMVDIYQSTDYLILLFIVVVIAAPVFEEVVFRGFMFKGLKHSRLGVIGSIIITSILFTLLHGGQYELSVLVMLFSLAVILGVARQRSGGIYLPIYLHLVNNLVSSIDLYLTLG